MYNVSDIKKTLISDTMPNKTTQKIEIKQKILKVLILSNATKQPKSTVDLGFMYPRVFMVYLQ